MRPSLPLRESTCAFPWPSGTLARVLLTLTTTMSQATDLGFLLHKHPDKAQTFPVSAGCAHVFYPRANDTECTAALLLEVDPIALVRGDRGQGLFQYVNDRPYAASSMLAVALGAVFRTAMNGRCDLKPELPGRDMPLRVHLPVVPARGGAELVRRLFEPLSWRVDVKQIEDSRYVDLRLDGTLRLADALNHLYVLLPVLDDGKHYWVSQDEVDKLLRAGEGWLAGHPERELISRRYLAHQRGYVRSALERLGEVDEFDPDDVQPDRAPTSPSRSCVGARCWPCCGSPGPAAWWTSAAGRGRCCGCWPGNRSSRRSSAWTCRRRRCAWRPIGSATAICAGSRCGSRR